MLNVLQYKQWLSYTSSRITNGWQLILRKREEVGGNVSLLPISLSPSAFSLPKKAKFFFVHVFEIYSAFASDSQINHSSLYLPTVQHNWTTMKDAIQVRGRTWS